VSIQQIERTTLLLDVVIKDALAIYMSRKEKGAALVVELTSQVRAAPNLADSQAGPAMEMLQELRSILEAISASVQQTAVSSQQLAAVLKLSNREFTKALSLAPLMQDDYWSGKMADIWKTGAAEAMAVPAIEEAISQLVAGKGDPWGDIQKRLPKWRSECRPGATALLEQACQEWFQATSSQLLDATVQDPAWLDALEVCRSRIVWLLSCTGLAQSQAVTAQLARVSAALSQTSSCLKLRTGLDLARAFIELPIESEEILDCTQRMLEAFLNCRGLKAEGADADTLEAALRQLGQKACDSKATRHQAELALALLAALPPSSGGNANTLAGTWAPEDWEKTLLGIDLEDWLTKVADHDRAPPLDTLTSVQDALRSFQACAGQVVGDADTITQAAQELAQWHTAAASRNVAKAAEVAKAAIGALEEKAGGGSAPGTSWKAALTEASSWEDIEREAKHHLQPIAKFLPELQKLHQAAFQAVEGWSAAALAMGLTPEPELTRRAAKAFDLSGITNTEAYFADVLCNARTDKRATKIHSRLLAMAKHRISQHDIQPGLWARAQNVAMSS